MERPKSAVEIFGSVRFAEENDMFHVPNISPTSFAPFPVATTIGNEECIDLIS